MDTAGLNLQLESLGVGSDGKSVQQSASDRLLVVGDFADGDSLLRTGSSQRIETWLKIEVLVWKVPVEISSLVLAQKLTRIERQTLGECTNSRVRPDAVVSLARTANSPKGMLDDDAKLASQIPESTYKYRWRRWESLIMSWQSDARRPMWLYSQSKWRRQMMRSLNYASDTCDKSFELIVA